MANDLLIIIKNHFFQMFYFYFHKIFSIEFCLLVQDVREEEASFRLSFVYLFRMCEGEKRKLVLD